MPGVALVTISTDVSKLRLVTGVKIFHQRILVYNGGSLVIYGLPHDLKRSKVDT